MDKLKMETPDITVQNIEKIGELFPEAITEARGADERIKKAINFETLRQLLSSDVLEGDEAYEFTWVGKKASMVEATKPIRKTLRPCVEESVNWDSTENLYIEGDNLDVLKLLQESYLGKVKMIYIDPPYNTGNDFVYEDNYAQKQDEYDEETGVYNEDGDRLFKNTDTNGRFHSDWCSMIYPRLKLASALLSDDGVIFISIDDHEQASLKEICDEVFGESNFLANLVWKRRTSSALDQSKCSTDHEYVFVYKKEKFQSLKGLEKDYKGYSNPDNDPRGLWTTGDLTVGMTGDMRPNQFYDLKDPKTGKIYKPNFNRVWSYVPESMEQLINDNRIVFPNDISKRPMKKRFALELKFDTNPLSTWLESVGLNTEATRQMYDLFGKSFFSYTKSISLIKLLIKQATEMNSFILDFFSGSATTAHAVMQLNSEDGGHRKFIMVQLPEACDEQSEAYKAGYKNICEIGKERIRRAGNKIKTEIEEANAQVTADGETKTVPDIGFRVLKLDDTNMKDVYYSAQDYDQQMLAGLEDNIKEDRTDRDLLFGCLLSWGLPLNLPYTTETLDGCTVHTYNEGDLIACFDKKVPEGVVRAIAGRKPLRAVFRDAGFASSPEKINVEEIFKLLAPNTRVKVI